MTYPPVFWDVIPCTLVGSYGFRTNVLPPILGYKKLEAVFFFSEH